MKKSARPDRFLTEFRRAPNPLGLYYNRLEIAMLRWQPWLRPGRRLLSMFLAVALLLGGTLLWLSWRLVRQDRELSMQRLQERREIAADLAVAGLQKSLARAEEQLAAVAAVAPAECAKRAAALAATLPGDSVLIADAGAEVLAYPEGRLPFYPVAPATREPAAILFAAADRLELQQNAYPQALAALQEAARSKDSTVRAAALLRTARILRKEKRWAEAAGAYEEMLQLKDAVVAGVPAELIARQQRIGILAQENRPEAARAEAAELLRALSSRRFVLTRGAYEFYLQEARGALGSGFEGPKEATVLALAAAAEWLHGNWPGQENGSGRLVLREGGLPVLVLWHASNNGAMALLLGQQWLEEQWVRDLKSTLAAYGAAIWLTDMSGQTVFGSQSDGLPHSLRVAADTHLPWHVHAVTTDPAAVLAPAKRRQNLVFAGMATIAALILTGNYVIGRTVTRELALSRLQSDFVSAVSHEFRTPLTSLCLLSEQLASGRVAGEQDRHEYFAILARESQRLRRLVEGLLNFGRMEAGAAEYRFETIDPAELVQAVSREFEHDSEARGHRIEVSSKEDAPLVRADRAALACAIWNLIDNAAKYSPECLTVWADVERAGGFAAIRIRDRGIGIPAAERAHIFDKFVRGEAARQSNVRGTGVGLAMVHHIVEAHRGELQVESKTGEGSAFTLLLPAVS